MKEIEVEVSAFCYNCGTYMNGYVTDEGNEFFCDKCGAKIRVEHDVQTVLVEDDGFITAYDTKMVQ